MNAAITAQKLSKSGIALYVGLAAHILSAEHQHIKSGRRSPTVIRTAVQSFKSTHTVRVEPDNFSFKKGRALNSRESGMAHCVACRENAIPCTRYSLGGEKVHQRGTLAALPLDAITKYGMECNCTLPLKHRARILNSEQERVIRVNFPQFRASLLEKEWEMSNPLAVILGSGKSELKGVVKRDWVPTGRIEFATNFDTNDDPNQPSEFKLLVERRVIESVAGNKHLEIQWRFASLKEVKVVAAQYLKYLTENSLIRSVSDPEILAPDPKHKSAYSSYVESVRPAFLSGQANKADE